MEKPLDSLMDDLDAKAASIRYGASKRLMILSESQPKELYPYWDRFIELLESPRQILRWNAMRIIGNLVAADGEGKFGPLFNRFFTPLKGPSMITAGNVIGSTPAIVKARPDLTSKILPLLFKVSQAKYQTDTCRDIAIGHVMVALSEMNLEPGEKAKALKFAQSHLENDRNSTRKKAQKLIKKLS